MRRISLRAYDGDDLMRTADVREGAAVAQALSTLLRDPAVATVHLHKARHGCFFCVANRS